MPKFTEEEVELLKGFVSDPIGNVFVVFPQRMPGMIGAAFARYSRARGGFRETLLREFIKAGVLDSRHADELIQRVLIAYGDDSVQQLESAWLSLEGVSNIATKAVEDRRLGAYIEQSSRYVLYDERDAKGRFRYLREPAIMASPFLASRYEETMDFVFNTYCRLIEPMQGYFRLRKPLESAEYGIRADRGKMRYIDCRDDAERNDFERTWRLDIRSKTCDTIRILLPAATLTNVGMHSNGHVFEHMLRRLYASNLAELQVLAAQAHQALNTVIPRYVQRAKREPYLTVTAHRMQKLADELLMGISPCEASAVDLLPSGYSRAHQLALMLFPYAQHPMRQLADIVSRLSPEARRRIEDTYLGERKSRRDRPGRALEYGQRWNIELVIDFGIFRDLHRHRMLTQERQLFTTRLGFSAVPEEIVEAGYANDVLTCAKRVAELYEAVRTGLGPEIAQYPVLFGFNARCFFGMSDREAQHLLELRTSPQGHRSYRRVCQQIARTMEAAAPGWTNRVFGFIDWKDYDWPRVDSEARQRVKEANL